MNGTATNAPDNDQMYAEDSGLVPKGDLHKVRSEGMIQEEENAMLEGSVKEKADKIKMLSELAIASWVGDGKRDKPGHMIEEFMPGIGEGSDGAERHLFGSLQNDQSFWEEHYGELRNFFPHWCRCNDEEDNVSDVYQDLLGPRTHAHMRYSRAAFGQHRMRGQKWSAGHKGYPGQGSQSTEAFRMDEMNHLILPQWEYRKPGLQMAHFCPDGLSRYGMDPRPAIEEWKEQLAEEIQNFGPQTLDNEGAKGTHQEGIDRLEKMIEEKLIELDDDKHNFGKRGIETEVLPSGTDPHISQDRIGKFPPQPSVSRLHDTNKYQVDDKGQELKDDQGQPIPNPYYKDVEYWRERQCLLPGQVDDQGRESYSWPHIHYNNEYDWKQYLRSRFIRTPYLLADHSFDKPIDPGVEEEVMLKKEDMDDEDEWEQWAKFGVPNPDDKNMESMRGRVATAQYLVKQLMLGNIAFLWDKRGEHPEALPVMKGVPALDRTNDKYELATWSWLKARIFIEERNLAHKAIILFINIIVQVVCAIALWMLALPELAGGNLNIVIVGFFTGVMGIISGFIGICAIMADPASEEMLQKFWCCQLWMVSVLISFLMQQAYFANGQGYACPVSSTTTNPGNSPQFDQGCSDTRARINASIALSVVELFLAWMSIYQSTGMLDGLNDQGALEDNLEVFKYLQYYLNELLRRVQMKPSPGVKGRLVASQDPMGYYVDSLLGPLRGKYKNPHWTDDHDLEPEWLSIIKGTGDDSRVEPTEVGFYTREQFFENFKGQLRWDTVTQWQKSARYALKVYQDLPGDRIQWFVSEQGDDVTQAVTKGMFFRCEIGKEYLGDDVDAQDAHGIITEVTRIPLKRLKDDGTTEPFNAGCPTQVKVEWQYGRLPGQTRDDLKEYPTVFMSPAEWKSIAPYPVFQKGDNVRFIAGALNEPEMYPVYTEDCMTQGVKPGDKKFPVLKHQTGTVKDLPMKNIPELGGEEMGGPCCPLWEQGYVAIVEVTPQGDSRGEDVLVTYKQIQLGMDGNVNALHRAFGLPEQDMSMME